SCLCSYLTKGRDADRDTDDSCDEQPDVRQILRRKQTREIAFRAILGPVALAAGCLLIYYNNRRGWAFWLLNACGIVLTGSGLGAFFLPVYWQMECNNNQHKESHSGIIVTRKCLTRYYFCNTVIGMANVLNSDK